MIKWIKSLFDDSIIRTKKDIITDFYLGDES